MRIKIQRIKRAILKGKIIPPTTKARMNKEHIKTRKRLGRMVRDGEVTNKQIKEIEREDPFMLTVVANRTILPCGIDFLHAAQGIELSS